MPKRGAESVKWQELADALNGCLIALDFDGTLAPLVTDPNLSAPAAGAVDTLSELAHAGAQIAIVTGRDAVTALKLSGLHDIGNLVINGLHGAQTLVGDELRTRPEPAGIAKLRTSLPRLLKEVDDAAWLEDKQLSLVVHTRRSANPERSLEELRPQVSTLAEDAGLEVHPGHLVLEIRMPGVDKGHALLELLTPDTTAALYAGDDHGDLPAVRTVNEWAERTGRPAATIAVGSLVELRHAATATVADPDALISLLGQLLPRS